MTQINNMHWLEAQEETLKRGPGNFVFLEDNGACIAGSEELGWRVITADNLKLGARTAVGVDLVLEELGLPHLGWG